MRFIRAVIAIFLALFLLMPVWASAYTDIGAGSSDIYLYQLVMDLDLKAPEDPGLNPDSDIAMQSMTIAHKASYRHSDGSHTLVCSVLAGATNSGDGAQFVQSIPV